jgi:exoribonuclease II
MLDEPDPLGMLERATRYRFYARRFADKEVRQTLTEFAVELEQRAGLRARLWQNGKLSRDRGRTRRLLG